MWFGDDHADSLTDSLAKRIRQSMHGTKRKKYGVAVDPNAILRPGFDAAIAAEITAMRTRLRREAASSLDPNSFFMRIWDGFTGVGLVFTAVVTPVEVGFSDASTRVNPQTALFWANRFVDVVFIIDIFIQFCLAYTDESRGNLLIRSRKEIAAKYLKSWFLIDVLSSIPMDVIQLLTEGGKFLSSLRIIRLIRLLRLLKLARVLRASRILVRWESMIAISYAHLTILKLAGMFVLIAHWMACVWGLAATARSKKRWTWLDSVAEAKRDKYGTTHFHKNSMNEGYILAFYFVLYTITGVGYGDVTPSNGVETVVSIVFIIMGGILWAYIIGNFCSILSTVDVYESQFRQSMDELNLMMEDRGFPSSLRRRCRTFFRQSRNQLRIHNYRKLEGMMSYALRGEAAAANNAMWLHRVWYLRKASPACIVEISQRLGTMTYAPLEIVDIAHTLFVLRRGIAARHGVPFSKGAVWGEDFVLENLDLADGTCACALTYIEVLCLSAANLYQILEFFPKELKVARYASAFYTVKSKLMAMAREAREKRGDSKGAFAKLYFNSDATVSAHQVGRVSNASSRQRITICSDSVATTRKAMAAAKKRAQVKGNAAAASTLQTAADLANDIAEISSDLAHYQERTEGVEKEIRTKLDSIESLLHQALGMDHDIKPLRVDDRHKTTVSKKQFHNSIGAKGTKGAKAQLAPIAPSPVTSFADRPEHMSTQDHEELDDEFDFGVTCLLQ